MQVIEFSTLGPNPTPSATDPSQPRSPLPLARQFRLVRPTFQRDLWTSRTADSPVRFSDGFVFSGALYFADLVQSFKYPN